MFFFFFFDYFAAGEARPGCGRRDHCRNGDPRGHGHVVRGGSGAGRSRDRARPTGAVSPFRELLLILPSENASCMLQFGMNRTSFNTAVASLLSLWTNKIEMVPWYLLFFVVYQSASGPRDSNH